MFDKMKPAQSRRLLQLRTILLTHFAAVHVLRAAEVKRESVQPSTFGTVWFTYEIGYINDDGSPLSILSRQFWFIEIGRKGAATAHVCPKSFHQFRGKQLEFLWPLRIAPDTL